MSALQVTDMPAARQYMQARLQHHNATQPADQLQLHFVPQTMRCIVHIANVLQQPEGHCLVVGEPGVGKRSMTCFAASLLGMPCPQLTLHQATALQDFRAQLKVNVDIAPRNFAHVANA